MISPELDSQDHRRNRTETSMQDDFTARKKYWDHRARGAVWHSGDLYYTTTDLGIYRLRREYLLKQLTKLHPTSVLDFGCGDGYYACFVKRRNPESQVLGVDISEAMIELAKERARREELEIDFSIIDQCGYRDIRGPFDLILCVVTLAHIPDKELFRVLKWMAASLAQGGRALVLERVRVSHAVADSYHVRRTPDNYIDAFANVGLPAHRCVLLSSPFYDNVMRAASFLKGLVRRGRKNGRPAEPSAESSPSTAKDVAERRGGARIRFEQCVATATRLVDPFWKDPEQGHLFLDLRRR